VKIAIEATVLTMPPYSGIARSIANIISAFSALPEVDGLGLYVQAGRFKHHRLLPKGEKIKIHYWHKAIKRQPKYDILFSPYIHMVPNAAKANLMWYYDSYTIRGICYPHPTGRAEFLREQKKVYENCQSVVCISDATRSEFLDLTGADPDHVHVSHLAVSSKFSPAPIGDVDVVRKKFKLDNGYLLFSGLAHENKNLTRLLAAYKQSNLFGQCKLVIAGPHSDQGSLAQRLRYFVNVYQLQDHVVFVGYLTDKELRAMYSGAQGFVFPSICEGFGLPILEAMACRAPVLTSDRSACAEVAKEHAILVDPYSIESIVNGINRLPSWSKNDKDAAQKHAKTFTWDATARKLLQVFQSELH